jgi:hypothetical protein
MRRAVILALFCSTMAVGHAAALEDGAPPPPLVTDRPDQTESSAVVAAGLVQVEAGWTHIETGDSNGDATLDGFGETLVRVGLGKRIELRVGFAGFRVVEPGGTGGGEEKEDGFGGAALGLKAGLVEERGARPRIALIAGTTIPGGQGLFSNDEADPFLRVAASNTLSERLTLGYNLGAAWLTVEDEAGDEDTLSVLLGTVSLGISATQRVGFFVELFGESGLSADGDFTAADAGVTWLVLGNLQLDASGGVGLSDSAMDWFAGLGVSFRLPR